jgi:hypothetical protein
MAVGKFADPALDAAVKAVVVFGLVANRDPQDMRWEVESHLSHMTDAELRTAYLASRAMWNVCALEIERRTGTAVGPDLPAPITLAAVIRQERERRSLSRPDFAALVRKMAWKLGDRGNTTTWKSVRRWEVNGDRPLPSTLRAIAAAIDRPVEELTVLGDRGPDRPPAR